MARAGGPAPTTRTPGTSLTRSRRTCFSRFNEGRARATGSSAGRTSRTSSSIHSPRVATTSPIATRTATSTRCAPRCRPTSGRQREAPPRCEERVRDAARTELRDRRLRGPDERLRAPGSADLAASLSNTHASFETPCGAYAHFKLTRYLLRVTRDSQYGDSMERVMYNTILGAKPLQLDGRTSTTPTTTSTARRPTSRSPGRAARGRCRRSLPTTASTRTCASASGVYVNLYIPSKLQWTHQGAQLSLVQTTSYPLASDLAVRAPHVATDGALAVVQDSRLGRWSDARGQRQAVETAPVPGRFATVRRTWQSGDRVELVLPMKTRSSRSMRVMAISSRSCRGRSSCSGSTRAASG